MTLYFKHPWCDLNTSIAATRLFSSLTHLAVARGLCPPEHIPNTQCSTHCTRHTCLRITPFSRNSVFDGFAPATSPPTSSYCRFHSICPSEKIGESFLFLGLAQIERHLCALLSICTEPKKNLSCRFFSEGQIN